MAALLLFFVEAWLHTDNFLYRYRSVFAAGRTMDKVLYAERHCPGMLIIGNSRADNGFDPRTLGQHLDFSVPSGIFNLGLPGADARVLSGVVQRLDDAGCLTSGVRYAVISLDEAIVQATDSLGQEVFFASRRDMLTDARYLDAARATLRLWGYSANFRQMREPATAQRFFKASLGSVEPMGGGAALHLGYRAGTGALQDADAALRQEAGSRLPPDANNVRHLYRMLDLLAERAVRVAIVFPPLLNREVLYRTEPTPASAPYLSIAAELRRRQLPMLALQTGEPPRPAEFVNAGHLNDRGAKRHSILLAQELNRTWGSYQVRLESAPRAGTP